jgi:hypothetical protein
MQTSKHAAAHQKLPRKATPEPKIAATASLHI